MKRILVGTFVFKGDGQPTDGTIRIKLTWRQHDGTKATHNVLIREERPAAAVLPFSRLVTASTISNEDRAAMVFVVSSPDRGSVVD